MLNKHSVLVTSLPVGVHFRITDKEGKDTGKRSIDIPNVCLSCANFEHGELGDYGSVLSPPYCAANVWWPTRKGTCGKWTARYGG